MTPDSNHEPSANDEQGVPAAPEDEAARALREANIRIESQHRAARDDAAARLADAERLAQSMIEEAKGRASEEGARIIAAVRAEAEAEAIRRGMEHEGNRIQRIIEFPSELRQAGIGILSYFSEVLKQKYPDEEMAVRIEQFGTKVRLTVDSPAGWRDTIEHDLETYAQVVIGTMPATSILSRDVDLLRLQNKLELSKVELEFEKRLNRIGQSHSGERIQSLEHQLERLYSVLGLSLRHHHSESAAVARILSQLDANETVREALRTLQLQLLRPEIDTLVAREALSTIKQDDPSVLKRLYELLSSTATGAAGTLLASLIESLLK